MNLIELLSQNITSPPDTIQFTKDRKFEEAWILPLSPNKRTQKEIEQYLTREPFTLIIVEYIWNSNNDDQRFVLTLFLDDKCQLKDPAEFINICLNLFYSHPKLQQLLDILDTKVIGHPYLFQFPAEAVNMGIFNHWLSVGPVDLWQKGDKYDPGTIAGKIQARPEIASSKLNYQGLFFRFNLSNSQSGPFYGLKTPCCTKQGNYWVVDFAKVNYWIKTIISSFSSSS
jgi:hypothetical protein